MEQGGGRTLKKSLARFHADGRDPTMATTDYEHITGLLKT
jgi:hypothetical protein